MMKKTLSTAMLAIIASPYTYAVSDEVLVTGSYQPSPIDGQTSSAAVVTKADLEKLSAHSLVDALRQVPSIWVEEQGGPGGVTAISLRGAESNHTLVLVDGVQVNDPTNTRGGAFDVNNLGIESIERIEIIRGAQSGVYGSDALAGVINIITVSPTSTQKQQLAITGGSQDYGSAIGSVTGTVDKLGYAVKIQTRDAGEPIKGSTATQNEAMVKLHWQDDIQTAYFSFRYATGDKTSFPEQSGGPLHAQSQNLDEGDYTDQNLLGGWSYQVTSLWKTSLEATWYNHEENLASPGIKPYTQVPPNGANTDFTRETLRWNNLLGNTKTSWANLGFDTKREDGKSIGYLDVGEKMPTDFALDRTVNGAFVNLNTYTNPDLLFQLTGRADKVIEGKTFFTNQIGVRYQVSNTIALLANRSEGFKLPSFFALGFPGIGNPALKPETSETFDLGAEWTSNQWFAAITLFENHYKNLIDFDAEAFTNVNRPPIQSQGSEVELGWTSENKQWSLNAHGSYANIDSQSPLLGRPIATAGTSISYAPTSNWQFSISDLWVSDRLASSLYTSKSTTYNLDQFNKLSASIQWQTTRWLKLNLSGDNLTNSHYQNDVGFPSAERSGYLKAAISF